MLRPWQVFAKNKINEIAEQEAHSLIAVNACVGSGKTTVAMQAMVDFIKRNSTEPTLQVFVCPRLALCKQQAEASTNHLDDEIVLLYSTSPTGPIHEIKMPQDSNKIKSLESYELVYDNPLYEVSKC